jgi:uncharacterized membrane protein YedE/YeeE
MGNGCTSGHGVCGISRLSPRSLSAVMTFMASGSLASYLANETYLKKYVFMPIAESVHVNIIDNSFITSLVIIASILSYTCSEEILDILTLKLNKITNNKTHYYEHITSLVCGILFSIGLSVSGMCNPNRVIQFLNFSNNEKGWDPSLAGVMGGAVLFNLFSNYYLISSKATQPVLLRNNTTTSTSTPSSNKSFSDIIKFGLHANNMKIDFKLLLGSAIFGLGWGIAGYLKIIYYSITSI